MRDGHTTPSFEGRRAAILHRPHDVVEALQRQLHQLGISVVPMWPDVTDTGCDVLFYDADMGHDGQFPWAAGVAPMPSIALIGSEAPGRLAWAIRQGADAHLLKPIGSGGVYSALVIATEAYARRSVVAGELQSLRARLERRQVVAEATACLMVLDNVSADAAYASLRRQAMEARVTIEDMAASVVARTLNAHVRDRA